MTLEVRGKVFTAKFTDKLFPMKIYAKGSRLLQLSQKAYDEDNFAEWEKRWLEFCSLCFDGDVSGLSFDQIDAKDYGEIVRFFRLTAEPMIQKLQSGIEVSEDSSPKA